MTKQEYNKNTDIILKNINKTIKKIINIEYHYNLFDLVSNINDKSKKEQLIIYEEIMNYYLKNIKKTANIYKIENLNYDINDIFSFFDFSYFYKHEDSNYYNDLEIKADEIVNDLIPKIFGVNNRTIKLPIKINFIIDFCIIHTVPKKEINKVLLLIIIKLAIIYNLLIN